METVLGLSLTSTNVGWVLVEGHEADGAILDHDEFTAQAGGGTSAVRTSRQVAAAVSRAEAAATAHDRRLHTIGMTWSDDAAAGAALLVESLTAAGFDNVVPVRTVQAAETLAQGLAPVVGYDKTAVCVLEPAAATVVTVDAGAGDTRTAATQSADGPDEVLKVLRQMFARDGWQPDCVVVVGSQVDLEELGSRLHDALPVPVFTQGGAELALARGAALASAHHAGFTDAVDVGSHDGGGAGRLRSPSYAGALTALIAAAVALVGALSLAVGLRVTSTKDVLPTEHVVHAAAAPRMPEPPAAPPAPLPPPAATAEPRPASVPAPAAVQAPEPVAQQPEVESPAELPEQLPAGPPAAPPAAPPPPPEPEAPPDPHPLLTKILERLRGQQPDAPPAQAPDAPAPPP